MRGMKSEDLLSIVDFSYYGEADIYQENLESFLSVAEELKRGNCKYVNYKCGNLKDVKV